jgi:hypothetical protein
VALCGEGVVTQRVAEPAAPVGAVGNAQPAPRARAPSTVDPGTLRVYPGLLERIAVVLPWLVLALAVLALVVYPVDVMFMSGLLAAAMASVLLWALGAAVPEALASVWQRRLLLSPKTRDEASDHEFDAFLKRFQTLLNHPAGWAVALVFAILAVPQFVIGPGSSLVGVAREQGADGVRVLLTEGSALRFVGIGVTGALGFVLGLFAWRMVVVGTYVYRLGSAFDCRVQTQHPDGAGGLAPLGTVCFLNALIVIVPSIFLGTWRTLIASVPSVHARYGYLEEWFSGLLVITFVLAVAGFFAPLYGVHRAMAREKDVRQAELDAISNQMDELTQEIRTAAGLRDTATVDELKKKLALLSEVYERERNVPTWPVDTKVLRTYVVSQLVPLLSITKMTDFLSARLFGTS